MEKVQKNGNLSSLNKIPPVESQIDIKWGGEAITCLLCEHLSITFFQVCLLVYKMLLNQQNQMVYYKNGVKQANSLNIIFIYIHTNPLK